MCTCPPVECADAQSLNRWTAGGELRDLLIKVHLPQESLHMFVVLISCAWNIDFGVGRAQFA